MRYSNVSLCKSIILSINNFIYLCYKHKCIKFLFINEAANFDKTTPCNCRYWHKFSWRFLWQGGWLHYKLNTTKQLSWKWIFCSIKRKKVIFHSTAKTAFPLQIIFELVEAQCIRECFPQKPLQFTSFVHISNYLISNNLVIKKFQNKVTILALPLFSENKFTAK